MWMESRVMLVKLNELLWKMYTRYYLYMYDKMENLLDWNKGNKRRH